MQSVLTPRILFLFFKPSTPCPHSFVVGCWFLECSFSGVISAGCRLLQGVFCGYVSSKCVNVIIVAGWLLLGMTRQGTPALCCGFALHLFGFFYEDDCPVPETHSIAAPPRSSSFRGAAAKYQLLCLGWL